MTNRLFLSRKDDEAAILQHLAEHGPSTTGALQRALRIGMHAFNKAIEALEDAGQLTRSELTAPRRTEFALLNLDHAAADVNPALIGPIERHLDGRCDTFIHTAGVLRADPAQVKATMYHMARAGLLQARPVYAVLVFRRAPAQRQVPAAQAS